MDTAETLQSPTDAPDSDPPIQCAACESALRSPGRETVSFLLLDRFTIPLVGCDEHLEQFGALCGLATEDSAEILDHSPAGGLTCPGCRHARYRAEQPVVPIGNGGLALLVCSTHQSDIVSRFRTGLNVRGHLTSSLEAF